MKKQIPVWAAILVVLVVLIIASLIFTKVEKTRGLSREKIDELVGNTAIKPGDSTVTPQMAVDPTKAKQPRPKAP
ncbi:MAG: hypothetical protein ACYC0V_12260 [Armatimonadota bacterium]